MFRESGIYDYLHKIGYNPLRIGPDIEEKPDIKQNFENISIQCRGILILYLIFTLVTFVIFGIESLTKFFLMIDLIFIRAS